MDNKYPLPYIIHGGDYNPDQWIKTPEVWDEDVRLMKLAHVNSATVGIFAWSLLEPEEGRYDFGWLETVLDKMLANGVSAILATPSGARPPWLAQKYPEVLRVEESGVRNEYGVRHNHCLTSSVYREKVRLINRALAERFGNHPALSMWHISNEYSGACHCELCQNAFRDWLREKYHGDIDELNHYWWNGFWSHRFTDFSQISSPKYRGENHVPALTLDWNRFVTAQHISFLENEIAPLRELTPDVPVTTNMMLLYDGIDYQEMAKRVDVVSWDSYPMWEQGQNGKQALTHAFSHDMFRSMKQGQPFLMMESTPANVNWKDVNKLPLPERQAQAAVLAVALGSDSVQYFQWRKSRGGHEKFHGAVVDHAGHENTRVFRQVTKLGEQLEKLAPVARRRCDGKVAVIYDYENRWATDRYCGYNNLRRDYADECIKWYAPFIKRGICVDVISETDDFTRYELVIAPFLYMLKDGVAERIADYVRGGGRFVTTYLCGVTDPHDLCYLGGFPAGELKEVFGVWAEETDSLPADAPGRASYNGNTYPVDHICDIIHAEGAQVLGKYENDFYAGSPAVTRNNYGEGTAWYCAFRSDGAFADDFCSDLIARCGIAPDAGIQAPTAVFMRKRGDH
ncbi:MAG: beta-galactosidase, partial [Clostridia bacterium]|nr:beta-galactosidase [Clostridia bacterium]